MLTLANTTVADQNEFGFGKGTAPYTEMVKFLAGYNTSSIPEDRCVDNATPEVWKRCIVNHETYSKSPDPSKYLRDCEILYYNVPTLVPSSASAAGSGVGASAPKKIRNVRRPFILIGDGERFEVVVVTDPEGSPALGNKCIHIKLPSNRETLSAWDTLTTVDQALDTLQAALPGCPDPACVGDEQTLRWDADENTSADMPESEKQRVERLLGHVLKILGEYEAALLARDKFEEELNTARQERDKFEKELNTARQERDKFEEERNKFEEELKTALLERDSALAPPPPGDNDEEITKLKAELSGLKEHSAGEVKVLDEKVHKLTEELRQAKESAEKSSSVGTKRARGGGKFTSIPQFMSETAEGIAAGEQFQYDDKDVKIRAGIMVIDEGAKPHSKAKDRFYYEAHDLKRFKKV